MDKVLATISINGFIGTTSYRACKAFSGIPGVVSK